jgi:methylphosphotriester-DNA--protein-cysteine methyltransferase
VKALGSFEERVEMLQNFFLLKLRNKQKKDHYIKFVQDTIQVYETANMQHNNSQLAEKMFTTSKTIQRYFNNVVGTTPKNYFSIYRTRVALTAYVANKTGFEPDGFGYYDMSHFYKDVVKFTGEKLAVQRLASTTKN